MRGEQLFLLVGGRASPLIWGVAGLPGRQNGEGGSLSLQSSPPLEGTLSWPVDDKEKQLLQTTWLYWNRFLMRTSPLRQTQRVELGVTVDQPLCWIHGTDLKVWTEVFWWLFLFSLGGTVAIWIQHSAVAILILVISFLSPQLWTSEMFLKGEAEKDVVFWMASQETAS